VADDAKNEIIKEVLAKGHSASYGVLLHSVSLLGLDPKLLEPADDKELAEWHGFFQGMRAALSCLAMHELRLEPEPAALHVGLQIQDAVGVLGRLRDQGTEG
jgi:hypothetical protein